MIEQQYPIANVPKYNFSDVFQEGSGLSQRLAELCLGSMKKLPKQSVGLDFGQKQEAELGDNVSASFEVIPLCALHEDVPVAAIDVSSIRVGETEEGIIIAVRGAIVWKTQQKYRFLRLGPFILHITEENKSQIFNLLYKYHFNSLHVAIPDFIHLQPTITSIFERWIQINLCASSSNSIILLDGSLTAGTTDTPEETMSKLLKTAQTRMNSVLAFSKFSRLYFHGHRLTDVTWNCKPPFLIKIDDSTEFHTGHLRLFGDIYVAKLGEDAVSFRLDIDKKLPQPQAVDAVQRLLGNELFYWGYPETLRLAHIYSTFTANEVLGMQRYLSQQCGTKIVIRPSLRRLLFGPFGKRSEAQP